MKTVEIQLPDGAFAGLDQDSTQLGVEIRLAAAVKWYEIGRVSQEMAAEVAGVGRAEFLAQLSRLHVSPMQETADEAMAAARLVLDR